MKTSYYKQCRLTNKCTTCGKPNNTKGCRCFRCLNVYKKRKKQLITRGLCIYCKRPIDNDKQQKCTKCAKLCRSRINKLYRKHIKNRTCYNCGKPALSKSKLCEEHWFKQIIKNRKLYNVPWTDLKLLLEKQSYKCAYTKIPLTLGDNASLDHIIPISKGGKNILSNLQWVDLRINFMKTNMTHKECIAFLQLISTHHI